jgi:hypothetical protein
MVWLHILGPDNSPAIEKMSFPDNGEAKAEGLQDPVHVL